MNDLTESKSMTEQTETNLTFIWGVTASWGCSDRESKAGLIEYLLRDLPLVQTVDESGAEDAYIESAWGKWKWGEQTQNEIREILRELCNYVPERREQILRATLQQLRAPKEERAKRRQAHRDRFLPILRCAIRAMSPRERAILRILHELESAGHDLDAYFTDGWGRLVEKASVKSLRDDPALRELVSLFDVAHSTNRTRK